MSRSSAQSWARPQGALSAVSALPHCYTLLQYPWVMSFFSRCYWKGSNTKEPDQPFAVIHHQTEELTEECENVGVC